ncbi:uncharacterized protein METZ01_LOCUS151436, partial [marine metagenome]
KVPYLHQPSRQLRLVGFGFARVQFLVDHVAECPRSSNGSIRSRRGSRRGLATCIRWAGL